MRLAESCDLPGIVAARVSLPGDKGSNPAGKLAAIVDSFASNIMSVFT